MKNSDFSKKLPGQETVPVQRTADHQYGTELNGVGSAYSRHVSQLQRMVGNQAVVQMFRSNVAPNAVTQRKVEENKTGLPNELKSGLESMSGYDLSNVKVHYNSDQPAKLQAHAYAQGKDIHVGPGQEKHLPHEGWHIIQQRQGRVQPTKQLKSTAINDDAGLEKEADVMGNKAYDLGSLEGIGNESLTSIASLEAPALQGKFATKKESNVSIKRNTHVRDKAMQLLSQSTNTPSSTTNQVIQRVLSLDTADFSEVNKIEKKGGAEGAYLVEDVSGGKVIIKTVVNIDEKEMIDSTVLSYNLAKNFGIKVPSARYLKLDSEEGRLLIEKSSAFQDLDLAEKLRGASAITLWEYIDGKTLGEYKNKGLSDEKVIEIRSNLKNFFNIGKMLVFDAAIFNIDRFKVELGTTEANAGNLMFSNNQLVGLDQDFARYDDVSTPGENFEGYNATYGTLFKELLSDPDSLAERLVNKMVEEKYYLFTNMKGPISEGIQEGKIILKELAEEKIPALKS